MQKYQELDPASRYEAMEDLAQIVFGAKWKGKLAEKYEVRPATVSAWVNQGPPAWVIVALSDAATVKAAENAMRAADSLRSALIG